ncbi:MAG: hypothetical protein FWC97_01405 [Treponema sp.]|nr:hypothetical protein [Treponema sp.]
MNKRTSQQLMNMSVNLERQNIDTKFTKPCSLRSHRFVNPTPKNGLRHYLALPTHHPEKNSKIVIESMKYGMEKFTVEMKRKSA